MHVEAPIPVKRLVIGLLLSLFSWMVDAATIYVNTFTDGLVDDGNCSLREAVQASNINAAVDDCAAGSNSVTDVIYLPPGIYSLDLEQPTHEDQNQSGDLDILGAVEIHGAGPQYTIIDGGKDIATERILHNLSDNSIISGISLAHGNDTDARRQGGGILLNQGVLSLKDVYVLNGRALYGGGISNHGNIEVLRCTVSGNQSVTGGGGIFSINSFILHESEVAGNSAGEGAGIVNGASMDIAKTLIHGNHARVNQSESGPTSARGGGLLSGGITMIRSTTISENQAVNGGGIYAEVEAGVNMDFSILLNNSASEHGGGLYDRGKSLVRTSTLSGNSAVMGGAMYATNGGILDMVTISENRGGGVFNESTKSVFVQASILSDNSDSNCDGELSAFAAFTDNIEDGNDCGFNADTNQVNTDPLLLPLADNGGHTLSYALQAGSPAVNRLNPADKALCSKSTDQRGFPRGYPQAVPGDKTCDIGAFERHAPYLVDSTADDPDEDTTDGVCKTKNGSCTFRAAVQQANAVPGFEEIILPAGLFRIEARDLEEGITGDFDIFDGLTIRGETASETVIDGATLSRILEIGPISGAAGSVVNLFDMTLTNGKEIDGGAIKVSPGVRLNLQRMRLVGNTASGNGGGIHCVNCDLTAKNSLFENNSATSRGGAIFHDQQGFVSLENALFKNNTSIGAVLDALDVRLLNNTFNLNTASSAIFAVRGAIVNTTISGNQVPSGALYMVFNSAIQNTILSLNSVNCGASANGIFSAGFNLTDSQDCPFNAAGDLVNTDPMLDSLANNGGFTMTLALLDNSPAIDAGGKCGAFDQRGYLRPADGNGDNLPVCDIGAFEYAANAPEADDTQVVSPRKGGGSLGIVLFALLIFVLGRIAGKTIWALQ